MYSRINLKQRKHAMFNNLVIEAYLQAKLHNWSHLK